MLEQGFGGVLFEGVDLEFIVGEEVEEGGMFASVASINSDHVFGGDVDIAVLAIIVYFGPHARVHVSILVRLRSAFDCEVADFLIDLQLCNGDSRSYIGEVSLSVINAPDDQERCGIHRARQTTPPG